METSRDQRSYAIRSLLLLSTCLYYMKNDLDIDDSVIADELVRGGNAIFEGSDFANNIISVINILIGSVKSVVSSSKYDSILPEDSITANVFGNRSQRLVVSFAFHATEDAELVKRWWYSKLSKDTRVYSGTTIKLWREGGEICHYFIGSAYPKVIITLTVSKSDNIWPMFMMFVTILSTLLRMLKGNRKHDKKNK